MHQRIRLLGGQPRNRRKIMNCKGYLFLETKRHNRFGFDVNLPAGQFGRQPGILTALADGKG